MVRVVAGPDLGAEFPITSGSSSIGRGADCDVVLHDDFISRRHIRVNITDTVEVVDLGSANGVHMAGERVQRAIVRAEDKVKLGDTELTFTMLRPQAAQDGGAVAFNRRPVVRSRFEGRVFDAPETPQENRGMRFPVVAMVAPLFMGLVMFAVSPSNKLVLVFMAMSPLLMLGSYLDQLRQSRGERADNRAEFQESVTRLDEEMGTTQKQERVSRLLEHPSTGEVCQAAANSSELLWSRRPDQPGFLHVRLGVGQAPSRSTLNLPDRRRATADDWATLTSLRERRTALDGVPIVADLRVTGGVGVAGPEPGASGVARSLILQLAGLHSPAELSLAALTSSTSAREWEWLKWIPHAGSAHSPIKGTVLADNAGLAGRLVAQIEELIEQRAPDDTRGESEAGPILPALVVIVVDDAPIERNRLVQIAEAGPAAGIHVVWIADTIANIPAACRSFVELNASAVGTVGFVHEGTKTTSVECEAVDPDSSLRVARRLSPIFDAGARIDDASDLPRSVSFLGSMGTDLAKSREVVAERWVSNDPTLTGGLPRKESLSLSAVVGHDSSDQFALDLRAHGPHALVGGTTGAGKSEFLQSWVLGMAAAHSPKRVTFLLVDYKGGSAFANCVDLPHCVGLVTDLSPHLVRRALTSLRAELTYREHVLQKYKVKDLIELEKNASAEQLPSLVIVVDEFAALVQEVPEFIDGVIDVAQRGRSLGLHLILATQRPSGVIKGSLRANTNLRVALRMADADDSTDVVGDGLAASFDPAVPGRAVAKTGPGRTTVFQSLYVGATTPEVASAPEIAVEELVFGQGALLIDPRPSTSVAAGIATDIERVAATISLANRQIELPSPRRPWLDVLAPVYNLALLNQRTDAALVIGVQDQPQTQSNRTVHFRPDVDGNLAVFGTGGTGKSTLLRTLAIAAAVTPRSGPCDVYALDFGSRGLAMLEGLPHVGAVINGSDHERLTRLLSWLKDEVEERSVRYAAAQAGTITEYRERSGHQDERRILVLVDGFSAFREEYEVSANAGWFTTFGQLAADGRAVGVHFVMATDRPSSIPPSLQANIQRRITLRLADTNDYALAGVADDILSEESPPGRGIMDGYEVQVAVLGASPSLPKQVEASEELGQTLLARGRQLARPIERLAERVDLSDLIQPASRAIAIGIRGDTLGVHTIDPAGSFLIAGPPSSGSTSSLVAIVQAMRTRYPDGARYLFTSSRGALRSVGGWTEMAVGEDEAATLAYAISSDLGSGALDPGTGDPVLIVVEGVPNFNGMLDAEPAMLAMAKAALDHGVFVVGEGETSALSQWGEISAVFRQGRRGIALQPQDIDGDGLFKTAFPRMIRSEFPPGRGMLVDAGNTIRIQMALPV
ncbi:MAG: FtsK/SpoIIIE domain-containing protein [Nocardioides sp.]